MLTRICFYLKATNKDAEKKGTRLFRILKQCSPSIRYKVETQSEDLQKLIEKSTRHQRNPKYLRYDQFYHSNNREINLLYFVLFLDYKILQIEALLTDYKAIF